MLATRLIFSRTATRQLMIPAAAGGSASSTGRSRRHRPRNHNVNNSNNAVAGASRSMATAAATAAVKPRAAPPHMNSMAAQAPVQTPAPAQTQPPPPQTQAPAPTPVPATSNEPARSEAHFSAKRFADAPISDASKQGIKHEFLSDVQAATLNYALTGLDLLVQAKTGTGKTLAFLLPSVERLTKIKDLRDRKISMLILSPTRELALQIEEEAQSLVAQHGLTINHAIGGTNMNAFSKRLMEQPPRILVATPGRLVDHLENTPNFLHLFNDLRVIVYDEADRLLDQGFKRELDKILKFLPDRTKVRRQALLFSATVSEEIKGVAKSSMAPNYKFISTLKDDEVNVHEHVPQHSLIVPFAQHLSATLAFLLQDKTRNSGATKAMIFLPTARAVSFFYETLSKLPRGTLPPLYEIHSRKSQPARIKAADAFKDAKHGVLISSDVTARGMDFPGVTLVIQTGLPANAEQYVHRLGRTARAGAGGRGILILSEPEAFFLRQKDVKEFNITPIPQTVPATGTADTYYLDAVQLAAAESTVRPLVAQVSEEVKAQTYRAFLGFYNAYCKGLKWSKEELVQTGNAYAVEALGWTRDAPPDIEKKTVGKMGLKGVRGLNIVSPPPKPKAQVEDLES
uniref:ATP-dependent RNA helicase n=1 Tax=Mycena chlorophos TaxID=658473 RepID=A0ABQ0LU50_MYCCL|nr:predicted protein [Mycena chlorophos]